MARILYFATLVEKLGRSNETVELPTTVSDVRSLLAWLRERGDAWKGLTEDAVRVTVNRQFANPATRVDNDAEIGLVPMRR